MQPKALGVLRHRPAIPLGLWGSRPPSVWRERLLRNALECSRKLLQAGQHQANSKAATQRERVREGGMEMDRTPEALLPYVLPQSVQRNPPFQYPRGPFSDPVQHPHHLYALQVEAHTSAATACPIFSEVVLPASKAPRFSSTSLFSKQELSPRLSSCPTACLKAFNCLPRDFPGGPVLGNPPANAGTQVRSLVQEDPTCLRVTKPASHNY